MKTILLALAILMSCGCTPPKKVNSGPTEYLHLHAVGSWGIDADIWILEDDTFRCRWVDSTNGEIKNEWTGKTPGLFARVVKTADELNAWTITNESLQAEYDRERGSTSLGVTDAEHVYIQFRVTNKVMVADFYAADAHAQTFPNAKQIHSFSKLIRMARSETKKS